MALSKSDTQLLIEHFGGSQHDRTCSLGGISVERADDVQLIHAVLTGDDAAFNTLVQKYQKSVHALAWRKIGDFHYAEEITQDTFIRAYKKLSTLRNPDQFAGWLYVIANRLCINWLQRKKPAMQSLEETPMEIVEKSAYAHYLLERREAEAAERRYEIVKRLLEKLPESERTVVTLHYLGEMTTKEIGKFLGVSANTIRTRLHRARKRLQADEELVVQEILGGVQIPASISQTIMQHVADLKPTPAPAPKPLLPWVALGAAAVLFVVILGATNRYLTRFQKPYSFEATSEPTIEIIEASVILDATVKPDVRNQVGHTNIDSETRGAGLQVSEKDSTPDTSEDSLRLSEAHWMPDANLREAVREALGLDPDETLTQAHLLQLTDFMQGRRRGISDLSGLEHATNLRILSIHDNAIEDLTPLANLTKLQDLNLAACRIKDVSLLANLASLETLILFGNGITDVTPLANLTSLEELSILRNPILDYTPLLNLPKTAYMDWQNTYTLPKVNAPVRERIASRSFPSIFGAWSEIVNLPIPPEVRLEGHVVEEELAYYDLYFYGQAFGLSWAKTPEGWKLAGDVQRAQRMHGELLSRNPNSVLLMSIGYFTERSDAFPLDFLYWLRDAEGNPRVGDEIDFEDIPEDEVVDFLLDFTRLEVQDMVVEKAVAVAQCGIYDGIMLGHWNEEHRLNEYYTKEEEHHARDTILQRIRAAVGDDFLIMVDTNWKEIPRWAPYINGAFMELSFNTVRHRRVQEEGYTREDLLSIENQLKWAETHFREPHINGLEGFGLTAEPPDSHRNQQWMRLFTIMSLIHSDGYVLYNVGDSHSNYWYDFWDVDLGQPIGEKGQRYENTDGLFIREFTNGWAVYNRSGKTSKIQLPKSATGVHSNIRSATHHLHDLDGEIYLK